MQKDIVVEITSLSKTFSMPGWRIGFALGNFRLIDALGRIKSYLDYGAFTPIQVAEAEASSSPNEVIQTIRNTYRRRCDVLVERFGRARWQVPSPSATMSAWVPIPEQFRNLGSLQFSKLLLQEANVAVPLGEDFGEFGEG